MIEVTQQKYLTIVGANLGQANWQELSINNRETHPPIYNEACIVSK